MLEKGYRQVIQQVSKGGRAGCWLQTFLWSSKCSYLKPPTDCSGLLFLLCYKSVTCIRTGLHNDWLPLELGRQRTSLKHQTETARLRLSLLAVIVSVVWPSRPQGKVKEDPTNTDCCGWDNEAILRYCRAFKWSHGIVSIC